MSDQSNGGPVEILLVEGSPGPVRLTIEAPRDATVCNNVTVAKDGVEAPALPHLERQYASQLDDLTGLYDRCGFMALAEQHLTLAGRSGKGVSLLFADLDGLKQISDTYGHREGDLALIAVADVLRRTFRDSDVIARLGGDEFTVLLNGVSEDGARGAVARLHAALQDWNTRSDRPYWLSLSVGLSRYEPGSAATLDELIASAEAAQYRKKSGRRPPSSARTETPGQSGATPPADPNGAVSPTA